MQPVTSADETDVACLLPAEWQDTPFEDVTGEPGTPDASDLRRPAMMGGNVIANDRSRIGAAPRPLGCTGIADVLTTTPVYVVAEDRVPNTGTTDTMVTDWRVWTLRSDVDLDATLELVRNEFPHHRPELRSPDCVDARPAPRALWQ